MITGQALAAERSAVRAAAKPGARDAASDDEDEAPPAETKRVLPPGPLMRHALTLIPYYAWAHRGSGEMSVWLLKSGTQYPFPN